MRHSKKVVVYIVGYNGINDEYDYDNEDFSSVEMPQRLNDDSYIGYNYFLCDMNEPIVSKNTDMSHICHEKNYYDNFYYN